MLNTIRTRHEFDRKQHRSYEGKSIELPHFTGEKKCNPTLKSFDISKERDNNEFTKSTLTNQLWARCRLKNKTSEAVVPPWGSFHKQTCVRSEKKASVGYLLAITDSPTKFVVVQCSVFLEVDQAIYNKVLRVLFAYQKK